MKCTRKCLSSNCKQSITSLSLLVGTTVVFKALECLYNDQLRVGCYQIKIKVTFVFKIAIKLNTGDISYFVMNMALISFCEVI